MKEVKYFLDITSDVCPMTLVRTKIFLEKLDIGSLMEIRLNAGEPLESVPYGLKELGHEVVHKIPEDPKSPEGVYRLLVRKS